MRFVLYICVFLLASQAVAAVSTQLRAGFHPVSEKRSYISEGVFIGGQGAKSASLLRVKLLKAPEKTDRERIYFQLGNKAGGLSSDLGYFHIAVEKNPARIVLDFSNLQKTAIGPEELGEALKKSKWIQSSTITMDPIDQSTNVTLKLQKSTPIAAFFRSNRPGRIYLELQGEKSKQ